MHIHTKDQSAQIQVERKWRWKAQIHTTTQRQRRVGLNAREDEIDGAGRVSSIFVPKVQATRLLARSRESQDDAQIHHQEESITAR